MTSIEIKHGGKPVLVLGGRERHALAIVRSLGRRGISVYVADDHRNCTSALSKYCTGQFVYPTPEREPEAFIKRVTEILASREFEMVFAVTDIIPILLSRHKNELSRYSQILVPDAAIFEQANNKAITFDIAEKAGVPIPQTHVVSNTAELSAIKSTLQYPVVLKPASKTILGHGASVSIKAVYANSADELAAKFESAHQSGVTFLVQEYIPGEGGQGVGLLCQKGETLAAFAFKRLHEYPVTGGASTLRVGIEHPEMIGIAKRLAKAMSWDGVAMVEFRIDSRDQTPKLIEVNGRFWGSLALAVYSGVDFPHLLYQMARGEAVSPTTAYKTGIKARWLIPGDLMYLLEALRVKPNRLATLIDFFQLSNVRDDVLSWDDPLPVFGEFKASLGYFFEVLTGKRSMHGELK